MDTEGISQVLLMQFYCVAESQRNESLTSDQYHMILIRLIELLWSTDHNQSGQV